MFHSLQIFPVFSVHYNVLVHCKFDIYSVEFYHLSMQLHSGIHSAYHRFSCSHRQHLSTHHWNYLNPVNRINMKGTWSGGQYRKVFKIQLKSNLLVKDLHQSYRNFHYHYPMSCHRRSKFRHHYYTVIRKFYCNSRVVFGPIGSSQPKPYWSDNTWNYK